MINCRIYPLTILALAFLPMLAQAESTQTLPTLYVDAQQTANIRPVTTYESPVSNLEFEPRVDLQSRNMAEAQGDVTIRGGIFENTGFRVGSATLIDAQTGHYSAELPIAPEMLTRPDILIGADNGLYGFNSTVGTISYDWSQIADGGSFTVGGGDHDLNFQRIHHGLTGQLGESGEWSWGVEAEISRSESDGTIQFGDHSFDRSAGRIQILGPNSQTDFFAGYQSKFFGWPGLYATPKDANKARSNETENVKTRLIILNHQQSYADRSNWEATIYHRLTSDHYVYNRFSPNSNYMHKNKATSFGLSGLHSIDDTLGINYAGQIIADNIDSKTLTHGYFKSRTGYKLSILPEYRYDLSEGESLKTRIGVSYDNTNRDDSKISAISDITWKRTYQNGNSDSVYLSYSESSQVSSYYALNSDPDERGPNAPPRNDGPTFQGNPDLGRESSQNLEIGGRIRRAEWSYEGAIFYRWDDDLVDWTYAGESSRSANAVDIETFGIELIASKRWDHIDAIASYTFLNKDEDYGNDAIEASFYALNYANHRITFGAIWTPTDAVQVRIDNEWRSQEDNNLRRTSEEAFFTHIGISVYPPQIDGLEFFIAVDNAWNDDFEEVPGIPGRGDQYSAGVTYSW